MSPLPPQAQLAFQGVLASVYQWPQTMFDGSVRTFECYVRPDSVAILPFLDAKKTLLLTRQEQPGRDPFWDVPGGRVDAGESHEVAARRELAEETGYEARILAPLHTQTYQGMTRFQQTVYLAKDLVEKDFEAQTDGERIELVPTPWEEVIQKCLRHELRQTEVMLLLICLEFNPMYRQQLETFLSQT